MGLFERLKERKRLKEELTEHITKSFNEKANEFGYSVDSVDIMDGIKLLKDKSGIKVTLLIKGHEIKK